MTHGHVTPNPDGSKARCGGPGLCSVCQRELGVVSRQPPATPTKSAPDWAWAEWVQEQGIGE